MLEETEAEETIVFFVISDISIGGGGRAPLGYAYVLGSFVLEMRKLLVTSEAEFNTSVGAGMGSKPSGKKAAVIFAFRE